MLSFQIWRFFLIELHKQTCKRKKKKSDSLSHPDTLVLETKRVEKGIVIAAQWHIGTKAQPEWFIYPPCLWSRETLSPHCLCLSWCTWGGERRDKAVKALKLLSPYLVYAERQCIRKGTGVQRVWPGAILCRSSLSLNKVCETFSKHRCILLQKKRIYDK